MYGNVIFAHIRMWIVQTGTYPGVPDAIVLMIGKKVK